MQQVPEDVCDAVTIKNKYFLSGQICSFYHFLILSDNIVGGRRVAKEQKLLVCSLLIVYKMKQVYARLEGE